MIRILCLYQRRDVWNKKHPTITTPPLLVGVLLSLPWNVLRERSVDEHERRGPRRGRRHRRPGRRRLLGRAVRLDGARGPLGAPQERARQAAQRVGLAGVGALRAGALGALVTTLKRRTKSGVKINYFRNIIPHLRSS